MAWRNPRLAITVTTTVSPGSRPRALAVEGADGDELVAVDQRAGVVDGQHPVGVAVEGQPDVGAPGHHLGAAAPRGGSSRSRR